MPGWTDWLIPVLAAKPAPAAGGGESFLPQIILFAPLLLLFYFFMIRPQQQQERKRRDMVEALKKNDRVLTSAGIYGTVVSVDPAEDRVMVRIDDDKGVKVAFSKAHIVRVLETSADKAAAAS
jgi:preprotein translocase subunit YajC